MQVAADVLNVLGFLRVDVARQWMALTVVEHHPLDELQELIRREKDLREVFEQKLPQVKLLSIDFKNAEATFEYDPAKIFPGAKPEQVIERFDNELRNATRHTFGAKPLRTIEKDKLKLVEIPIVGLDCKACSFAVYEMVYRLKGVEQATASFKEGKLTALIAPEKIDRTEIEMTLKQRGVQIKPQE